MGDVGSWVVEGVSGALGLLHKLVAFAEVPSKLLSMGEMGFELAPRCAKVLVAAEAGGESNLSSVVGTGTREIFLSSLLDAFVWRW